VIETGESGPITPVGINLPNDQGIRERYGSKSVSLSNVKRGLRQVDAAGVPQRVLVDAEEAARARSGARSPAS
jgi:dipeptidyl-peptidase-3